MAVVSLLLAGCFHQRPPAPVEEPEAPAERGIDEQVDKLSRQFGIEVPETGNKAALTAVDGSPSSGLAIREIVGTGMVSLTIVANLPDLSAGQRYLARLRDDGNIVELGELRVEKAGWLLERSVNVDPSTQKTVEVYRDGEVILRGSFD